MAIESTEDYEMSAGVVGVVMGSDSDLSVVKLAAEELERFGISYEVTIVSAHRTPDRLWQYVKEAINRNVKVFIVGAGGAAHLAGIIAALTIVPVIGVPLTSQALRGIDSLYSILPMPVGRPIATMTIGEDGARNAAYLAAQILGLNSISIQNKLANERQEQPYLPKQTK